MPELCKSLCGSIRFGSSPERLLADTNKLARKTSTMFHVIASPEYSVSLMIITSSKHVAARAHANKIPRTPSVHVYPHQPSAAAQSSRSWTFIREINCVGRRAGNNLRKART